jgi:hypothetical protein
MTTVRRLDEVSIFNDKVTFLIPHEWVEVESGDNGTYQYQVPDAQSGWFRASLITTKDVGEPAERLEKLFRKYEDVVSNEVTGNLIRRSEKNTVQDGEKLHIYYWFVGGCVSPNIVCEAVFSYTVLSDLADNSDTRLEVKLLDQLVSNARFNPTDDGTGAQQSE